MLGDVLRAAVDVAADVIGVIRFERVCNSFPKRVFVGELRARPRTHEEQQPDLVAIFTCDHHLVDHHLHLVFNDVVDDIHDHVVDTGPYRLVRHPIYSGLIFAAFATAIKKGTSFALLGVTIVALACYIKVRREECFLRAELGANAYDAYARKTAMLVPFVRI